MEQLHRGTRALSSRQPIILVDDGGAKPLGYLLISASAVTAEDLCFLVNHGRGVVCAALTEERLSQLGLNPMVAQGAVGANSIVSFAVSVDARQGITTGISAADRASALRVLANTSDPKRDLVMPGHIFPWIAHRGGVLVRTGVPEAAIELLGLADQIKVGALCHCLNANGDFCSLTELQELRDRHNLVMVNISEIVRFKMATEQIVERIAESSLPTKHSGIFRAVAFRCTVDGSEHLALVRGTIDAQSSSGLQDPVLARVQAEHRLGDLLGTEGLGSRKVLNGALRAIADADRGVLVYIRHPRRSLLQEQVETINSQTEGPATISKSYTSAIREYGIGAQILSTLGVQRILLLTNTKRDIPGLKTFQLEIVGRQAFNVSSANGNA